ncbi:MAG: hypothetical protein EOP84_28770 [Verrucomicrobiaceae bacterium]|nr:MAG: hypothetical protein EOP84_28770 [Verrucomicrobiaceae bacterium]
MPFVFTRRDGDELPLPEDYLVRGLIWAHNYFPKKYLSSILKLEQSFRLVEVFTVAIGTQHS